MRYLKCIPSLPPTKIQATASLRFSEMPRFSDCWRCGETGDTAVVCRVCGLAKYCSNSCLRSDKFRHDNECRPVAIVKTCSSCKKCGTSLRACTGCYKVFYCDAKCQKSHRKEHKANCNSTKEKIQEISQRMFAYFCSQIPVIIPKLYYWGNYPAFDGVNLHENEGVGYSSDLRVLYLGVGDLRNVVLSCARLPNAYEHVVEFTLNDRESCVLARLVLLLYMLVKGDAGVEKIITEIWYSVLLSKQTYKYLLVCLRELVDTPCAKDLRSKTAGLITLPEETHLHELKRVWIKWHNLKVRGTTWIQEQREKEFNSDAGSYCGRVTYFNAVPQEHVKSAKKWMNDGVFKRNQSPAFAENPTLTGFPAPLKGRPYSYSIPSDVLPFTGWDYLDVKKFKHTSSLVTMYGAYIENLLRIVVKKLVRGQVCFKVLLCDCMAIPKYVDNETKYDRILTTNLMDYILLPDLLEICSLKLRHSNPYATIVTESQNWTRNFCPEGDVTGISNMFIQGMKLADTALQDTKNPKQIQDGGTAFREYLDNSGEFVDFLRALFYTYSLKKKSEIGNDSLESVKVPTMKMLGSEFQLRLRDGFRNENRIAKFKLAVNRRRVSMIAGVERVIEWVSLQSE